MDLSGSRVLITGAARGIGAATARRLAGHGARVGLVGLEPDALGALHGELGPGHAWAEADVTDQGALNAAVAAVEAELGGLDVVVANAGVASFGTVRTLDVESFARTVDVNLTGVYRTATATLPALEASEGYLLIVASVASFLPTTGFAAYGASKAGVEALANALRIELAPAGIDVGSAHMSWIDTDMVRDAEHDLGAFREMRSRMPWPLRSTTSVPACVDTFVRAIERRSRKVYVPGSIALVDWGRPVLLSRLGDLALRWVSGAVLPGLERESRSLGRSLSDRAERIRPRR